MPPAVETCHWPADAGVATWRNKRPDVNLCPSRFVRLVRHPPAVRRERAKNLVNRGFQKHRWLAVPQHRHDPQIPTGLRSHALIQQETPIRRPTRGARGLVRRDESFLYPRAVRALLVEVNRSRPIRAEREAGAVGCPNRHSVDCRIERESARVRCRPSEKGRCCPAASG